MRFQMKRRKLACLARWILAGLLPFAGGGQALAQEAAFGPAATQIAQNLLHSKVRSVAVVDFFAGGTEADPLGEKLADDLSTALAAESSQLLVVDRSVVIERQTRDSYVPDLVGDPGSAILLGKDLKVQAVVGGTISIDEHNALQLDVEAYRVGNGERIVRTQVSVPITPKIDAVMNAMATRIRLERHGAGAAQPPHPGPQSSRPMAICEFCAPPYDPQILLEHVKGVVSLMVAIDAHGRVKQVTLVRGLPGNLNSRAINAVKQWRFHPAIGPEGKPVAVEQMILISFVPVHPIP